MSWDLVMKWFIIATGLVSLPNLENYWETNSILSQPGIVYYICVEGVSHQKRVRNMCMHCIPQVSIYPGVLCAGARLLLLK